MAQFRQNNNSCILLIFKNIYFFLLGLKKFHINYSSSIQLNGLKCVIMWYTCNTLKECRFLKWSNYLPKVCIVTKKTSTFRWTKQGFDTGRWGLTTTEDGEPLTWEVYWVLPLMWPSMGTMDIMTSVSDWEDRARICTPTESLNWARLTDITTFMSPIVSKPDVSYIH